MNSTATIFLLRSWAPRLASHRGAGARGAWSTRRSTVFPLDFHVGEDSLGALQYRLSGARPLVLEVAVAYASFFYKLVQHVSFEGDVITAGALHQRDWGIAVRTFLPSRVKRQCTS